MFISVTSQGDWGHVTIEGLDLRVKELGNLNVIKFNDGNMPIHNSPPQLSRMHPKKLEYV